MKWSKVLIIIVVPVLVIGFGFLGIVLNEVNAGVSARDKPTAIEAAIAETIRGWGMPRRAKSMQNPVALTPEVMTQARRHYADHCAICHANDGSGDTEMGRGMYPKPPDMRSKDTQSMSDGEIYYTIHNGVRLTGMPAWGAASDADHDNDSWALVHFIRHLPQLTASELSDMQNYNPKSPAEMQEEKQEEKFLNEK